MRWAVVLNHRSGTAPEEAAVAAALALRTMLPAGRADMRTLVHLSDLHFGRIDPSVVEPLRRAFLDSLEPPKLVVPGNHDVPL